MEKKTKKEAKKPVVKEVLFNGKHSAKDVKDNLGVNVSLTYNPIQLRTEQGIIANVGDTIVSTDGILTIKK